jgi:hypothetical protein
MRICHCQEDWQQEFAVDYLEDLVAGRKHKLGYEQGILPQTSISYNLQLVFLGPRRWLYGKNFKRKVRLT